MFGSLAVLAISNDITARCLRVAFRAGPSVSNRGGYCERIHRETCERSERCRPLVKVIQLILRGVVTPSIELTLARIDDVLKDNRKIEYIYIILTAMLFLCGIACIVTALATGKYAWSAPSTVTTGLLYWPLREIRSIRSKNIALATAPILIATLPPAQAAKELQLLLHTLYVESR